MIPFEPLWAVDVGGIIAAIFVIIMVITAIGNMIAKMNEQQAKGQRRPGGAPRAQQPQQQGGGRGGGIGDEIAEFLRRAAQGQAAPQQPQAPPPPRPARRKPLAAEPVEAVAVADEPGRRAVGTGIDTSRFEQSTGKLGGDVTEEQRKFDEHLHGTFDHEVSELAGTRRTVEASSEPEPKRRAQVPSTAAAGFAAMLSNADNIRQAIVITEILNRPLDRWQ